MFDACPRCNASLPNIDGAAAAFCGACGLHQLRVPSEALEPASAEQGQSTAAMAGTTAAVEWRLAFRTLTIATLLGMVPCILRPDVVITGGAGILALLLLPLLTLGSSAAYLRRRPFPLFTPATGARLGLVLALLLAGTLTAASGAAGFIARYGFHSHIVPAMLDLSLQQSQAWMAASGTPLPPGWSTIMHWPEVRAGSFLFLQAMVFALLLLDGIVSGTVAGALLGARQRRSRA